MKPLLTLSALCLSIVTWAAPLSAQAAISTWQKGVIIDLGAQPTFTRTTLTAALEEASENGVNFITYVIPYYQTNAKASEIHTGWNTPTDEQLIEAIALAHAKDLKVMLKPMVEAEDYAWRPLFAPADRAAWFTSYQNMLLHVAQIAEQTGVEQICIGSGLFTMTSQMRFYENTKQWENIIARIRQSYKGLLTYSALDGWPDEKKELKFWSKLDYIGIAAFHGLSTTQERPSETSLRDSWDAWHSDLRLIQEEFGKPLLFTEMGYKSIEETHRLPLDWREDGKANEDEQAAAYQAAFSYWSEQPKFAGMHLWKWEVNPTQEQLASGYTPQGKKALSVMRKWFNVPPFRTFAYVAPFRPQPLKTAKVHVRLQSASDAAVQDVQVMLTICDAQRTCAAPSVYEHQNFQPNALLEYTMNWKPTAEGVYTVNAQVLKQDGSRVIWKKDAVLKMTVKANKPKKTRQR